MQLALSVKGLVANSPGRPGKRGGPARAVAPQASVLRGNLKVLVPHSGE